MLADGIAAALAPGDHVCATYGSAGERRAVLRAFVHTGVRAGHKVICLVGGDPRELTLHDGRPGQVRVVVWDRDLVTYRLLLDQLTAEIDRAARGGFTGLRVAGEMAWVLPLGDGAELVTYESTATTVLSRRGAVALCLYDRTRFAPATVRAAGCVHGSTVHVSLPPRWPDAAPDDTASRVRFTYVPGGVALSGEVDESNAGALRAVLADLPGDAITVDASDLGFLAVAGATELIRAARTRPVELICGDAAARTIDLAGGRRAGRLTVTTEPREPLPPPPTR